MKRIAVSAALIATLATVGVSGIAFASSGTGHHHRDHSHRSARPGENAGGIDQTSQRIFGGI
jgi:hypothetical protein